MRSFLLILLLIATPGLAAAQETSRPILRTELEKQTTVPGQPIILRITLLVPTWLPQPPLFPSFETPNVIVRLPARASGPTSDRIGGATWSGVTRAYRLYPMTPGHFRIPPQPVTVTFADPETREPLVAELQTEEIVFDGAAPEAAVDLDPFIAAQALTLEQSIEGEPENLDPGGAVTRVVAAKVKGISPIFLPPLVPTTTKEGLAAYPKEPVVTEKEERGVLSGERTESITYVAEAGGRFEAAPVRLRWFNLKSGQVETAELPGFPIVSRGPPPAAAAQSFDWRSALPWIAAIVVLVGALGFGTARAWPRIDAWRRARRDAHRASEGFAFARAAAALRARKFGAALFAIQQWSRHMTGLPGPAFARLDSALTDLGRAHYGQEAGAPSSRQWSEALQAFRAARREALADKAAARVRSKLPPLNPVPH